jgi:prophage regulatory protein
MKFIKLNEVKEITALGRSSIYAFIEEGKFPKQVSLGGRAVAWVESEVIDWIESKIQERDQRV